MKTVALCAYNPAETGKPYKKGRNILRTTRDALSAGALAAGVNYAMFPLPVKTGVKNAILGEDKFVAKTVKKAGKLAKKAGESFNAEDVALKAKDSFAKTSKYSRVALDNLKESFVSVAACVVVGNIISDVIISRKVNKDKA